MTDEEMLGAIKEGLNITGDYQDASLRVWYCEAKEFLLDAGVAESIVRSTKAIGILTRGVADLWNYGAGNASLSPYFKERAIQLVYKSMKQEEAENEGV